MTILTAQTNVPAYGHWVNPPSRAKITINANLETMTWWGVYENGATVDGTIFDEEGRIVLWDDEECLRFPFSDLSWTVKKSRTPPPLKESDTVKELRAAISDCYLETDCWDEDDRVNILSPGGLVSQLRLQGLGPESWDSDDLVQASVGTKWSWRYRYRGFIDVSK